MIRYALLLLPIFLGIYADATDYLPAKMGVPLCCAGILTGVYTRGRLRQHDIFWLIAAFVFSALGDYFLSNKKGNESFFVISTIGNGIESSCRPTIWPTW